MSLTHTSFWKDLFVLVTVCLPTAVALLPLAGEITGCKYMQRMYVR